MIKRLLSISLVIALAALLASCGEAGGAVDGFTPEFKQFLEIRKGRPENSYSQELDGYIYALENGVLRVFRETEEIWQSDDSWYVEDFRLGDVDGDGNADVLMSLWKSYSFGAYSPQRMENDDASVRCHLFLYTVRADSRRAGGRMKQLWGSSNLPRPIYEFELTMDGERTPVASGAVLRTVEGRYTEDFSRTEARGFVYVWRGWGFAEE